MTLMFTVGSQGRYEWLVADEDFDILELCPEIVLGKYIAVTSIDSSQLVPTDKETAAVFEAPMHFAPPIQTTRPPLAFFSTSGPRNFYGVWRKDDSLHVLLFPRHSTSC